jgi:hypothetical protein
MECDNINLKIAANKWLYDKVIGFSVEQSNEK